MKLRYGYAVAKDIGSKETVELTKLVPDAKGPVSRRFVGEIIESRLEEIFEMVSNELKIFQKVGELPGGVVITGGGAKLPGLTDYAKQEMRVSAQIGCTLAGEWENEGGVFKEFLEDPEFVGVFGLVLWGVDGEGWGAKKTSSGFGIRNVFKYFAP